MSLELCYLTKQAGRKMELGNPWAAPRSPLPVEYVADKPKRAAWLQSTDNTWPFYSVLEGVAGNSRINKENPPHLLRGVVVDFDLRHTAEEIEAAVASAERRPSLLEWSISPGKWRAIWLLDKPLMVPPSVRLLSKFLEDVIVRKLRADSLGRGRDPKSGDATQVFAIGRQGVVEVENDDGTPVRLPRDLVQGWLMEYMSKHPLEVSREADKLLTPEAVAPLLLKKYPAFSEWPGEFVEGAQGPTFWVEGSKSPQSAKVHKAGLYTWSATAQEQHGKAWWSWTDLLGEVALDEFKATRLADLVKDVYYDGQSYHVWTPELSTWTSHDRDAFKTFLRSRRGVRAEKGKNEPHSEMDDCLTYIHTHSRVVGAAPFLFRGERLIESGGGLYLNTGTKRLKVPSYGQHSMVWGDGFPVIAHTFDQVYDCHHWELDGSLRKLSDPETARWATMLAHHGLWLQCLRDLRPRQGQAVIIAGRTGVGKTLFARRALGGIVGGYSDASKFLKGEDTFGAELFQTALWCVDDGSFSTDNQQCIRFTETLKSVVANPEQRCHQKFKQATLVDTTAVRVFVTMNDSDKTLVHAPVIESTILDKIILLRASSRPWKFDESEKLEKAIRDELPAFGAFMLALDWRALTDLGMVEDSRYGVRAIRDDALLRRILRVGYNAGLYELLFAGLDIFFESDPTKERVELGTMGFMSLFDKTVQQFRSISNGGRVPGYDKWKGFLTTHHDAFPDEIGYRIDERGNTLWTFTRDFVERGKSAKPLREDSEDDDV